MIVVISIDLFTGFAVFWGVVLMPSCVARPQSWLGGTSGDMFFLNSSGNAGLLDASNTGMGGPWMTCEKLLNVGVYSPTALSSLLYLCRFFMFILDATGTQSMMGRPMV